jgi:hypothetical protein
MLIPLDSEQERSAMCHALLCALEFFNRSPPHWVRPGTQDFVATVLRQIEPTREELKTRPFVMPNVVRKHAIQLMGPAQKEREQ